MVMVISWEKKMMDGFERVVDRVQYEKKPAMSSSSPFFHPSLHSIPFFAPSPSSLYLFLISSKSTKELTRERT